MAPIHVVQSLGGIGGKYGGPSFSVPRVSRALAAAGCTVEIVAAGERGARSPESTMQDGVPIRMFPFVGPNAVRWSGGLRAALRQLPDRPTIFHANGIWMHPHWAAGAEAHRRRMPLLVAPRGMMQPWALAHGGTKKKVVAALFANRFLHRVSCFHALVRHEIEDVRRYGLEQPVALIPNGTDTPKAVEPAEREAIFAKFPQLRDRHICLCLSRLHPKKNVGALIDAWAASAPPDWTLAVAGEGDAAYEAQLKEQAARFRISAVFTGGIYGTEKRALLSVSHLFALPSFCEGFSMSILEAAAWGMPVVMTPECNFPELEEAGGGVICGTSADSIAAALSSVFAQGDMARGAMGECARTLVREKYSWESVAAKMTAVYRWLLDGGERPECVA